jgi:diguanylate cyclase (GGDEF)-like protein/PAS domain S-box-containing protein
MREMEENLLQAFLEHIPDGVYFKDRQSRFVRISRSLAVRFGFKNSADAINKTDFDVFGNEHAKQAFADEQEIICTGQPIVEKEEKETWPDGRESWVLTTKLPLMDDQGTIIGTMGISRDITERRRVERELQEYRVRLEELVASRTAELVQANELLEQDIAARKVAEQELALKAQQLTESNAILANISLIDDLTGLYNRKGFFALAEHRAKVAYRSGEPFSVAFIDLDGLKSVNDTLGHLAGNSALVDAANILKDCFRQSDILARLGGDEFSVFVAETDETKIPGVVDRIQQHMEVCNSRPNRPYRLSFSVGIVSSSSAKESDLETLLGRADRLMYEQKRHKGLTRDNVASGKN